MGLERFAALLAVLGLLQSSGAAFTWKPCPDVSSKGSISSVSLSPDPPYPGSTASFIVEGVADAGLESGSLDIGVSYHGFPIYTQSQDLCDATRCPIKKGPLTVKLEEPFPIITPPGPYTVRLSAVGDDPTSPLLCLDVDFSVVPQSLREATSAQ